MRRRVLQLLLFLGVLAVCGAGLWLLAVKSGLLQPSEWEAPPRSLPVISTRRHLKDGKPTAAHGADDYSIDGKLPGLAEDTTPPADLLIVVHGYNNTAQKALYKFGIAEEALRGTGYSGVIAGFSWDADTQGDPLAATGYHEGLANAAANGPKLARFIEDYAQHCPQSRIHLVGYSMGARVALEAVLHLPDPEMHGQAQVLLASVHLVGAAVENEDVETGERYGAAIATRCRRLYNYFSPEDNKLAYFYPLKEGDRALGLTGIEHAALAPPNYMDVDVTRELPEFDDAGQIEVDEYGDNHSGYLGTRDKQGRLLDNGVMDLVAENLR